MGKKEKLYADIMSVHPEVTGSCNLVACKIPDGNTIRFIVDCGLFQERGYDELNTALPFNPEGLEFCIVTHNHVDHTGRLPYLVKKGFYKSVYMTENTGKLIPLALNDSYKVLRDVAKRRHARCLYEECDVEKVLGLVEPCKYGETIAVHPNVDVTFFPNGHLIGAALVLVQIHYMEVGQINLLFTGDYNSKNMFFDVEDLPDWVLDLPLTIVQESTYGYMESSEMHPVFEENVLRCLENNGTVICPVFSLGRSQEIMYVLKCMQDSGKLDTWIPIYLDGKLAIKYTDLYLKDKLGIKEDMWDFLPMNMSYVSKLNRQEVLHDRNAKIVLTTSGMGSYGPAQVYIPEYLTRGNALIHFTGYTSEGTLGARLKNTPIGGAVEVGGQLVTKRARVEYTSEFSAHAKADEMIAFLQKFRDLKLVLVNHGQCTVKTQFAERILKEVESKNVGILGREYLFRVNPYGLVKTLATKFE